MTNKKVLLLGASGFLGSKILEFAPSGFSLYFSYEEEKLKGRGKQVKIDLLDFVVLAKQLNKIRPQIIIHAARIHPYDNNPKEAERAMKELVKIIKSLGSKLIYISSDSVFDGKKGNYKESDKARPITDYGKAKLAAEKVIKNNLKNYIIIRPSYIYDRNFNELDKREAQLLERVKNGEMVYRLQDAFRSPVIVADLAKAVWRLADKDFVGVIHVGGKKQSIYNFYKKLVKDLGLDDSLIKPDRIGKRNFAPDTSLNTSLAKKILK